MTVHVINLERDTERLARFMSLNGHVPDIVRVPAVDGKAANRKSLHALGVITEDLIYTNGAIGCALSHLKLWRRAISERRPITVVEDDTILARNFQPAHEAILSGLPEGWDIVLWGWNFDEPLWTEIPEGVAPALIHFDQKALRANIEAFRRSDVRPASFRLLHALGTMGYTLSPSGAAALLRICLPLANVRIIFDDSGIGCENKGLDCIMNAGYGKLKAYVSVPPLVISENRHETSNTAPPLEGRSLPLTTG